MSDDAAEEPSSPWSLSSGWSTTSSESESPPREIEIEVPEEGHPMPDQGQPLNFPPSQAEIPILAPTLSYEPDVSISEQIDFLLGEFGVGPEPFHPVPEEFLPMLEQLEKSSEQKLYAPRETFHVVPDCSIPELNNSVHFLQFSGRCSESYMCDMFARDFQEVHYTYMPIPMINVQQGAIPGQDNLSEEQVGIENKTINELCNLIDEDELSLSLGESSFQQVQSTPMPMPYQASPNPYLAGLSYMAQPQSSHMAQPQLQQMAQPQLPHMAQPQLPHMAQPQLPHIAQPQLPHMAQPQLPHMAQPQSSHMAQPQLPQMAQPQLPHMAQPQLPHIAQPQLPHMAQLQYHPPLPHLAYQMPGTSNNMQQMPHMAMEPAVVPPTPAHQVLSPPRMNDPVNSLVTMPTLYQPNEIKGESPRELRNRAEKQRRDKLNQSISLLATIVPPVVAMPRKIDKTTIMRLTAHYLRSHQYVFGDAIEEGHPFKASSTHAVLSLIKGFVLTITYRGIVVVVSPNIRQFLGYSELDLIGTNVYAIVHDDDHKTLREQLMPRTCMLGKYGELLIPDEPDGMRNIALTLARERRSFVLRFKRLGHRSELAKYVTCHVEGSLRKSDRACRVYNRCCHIVRRARARGENPRSSGNDIVFVGVVRPTTESFFSEGIMESFRMEYRTRHSVDGEIIQCEQRIALVTGYMTQEVSGINAMNFMHRDDVRWVVIALREMYEQHRLFGESCYRLMTKNGEFVYMRTRGRLDVDENSKIAKSFVCTNTVVSEEEGKFFIDQMKKRFNILVNNCPDSLLADREGSEPYEENSIPVEDPRQLEKVILHLVTNLPSPESSDFGDKASAGSGDGCHRISIIAPKKERIVNAIKNITHVFYPRIRKMKNKNDQDKLTNKNNTSNIENKNTMENTHHSRPGAFSMSETSGKKVVISSNSNNCQTISHDTQNNGLSQSCNLPPPQQSMLASTQSYMPTVQSAETSLANARYIQVDYTQPQIYAIYDGYGRLINYQQPTSSHVNGSPFLQQQSNQGGLIGSQMFAAHPQNVGTAFGMPTTASQAFYMLQSNISNETPQQQNYFGYVTQFPSTHIDGRSLPSTSTRNAGEMPVFNFQEQAMPAINAHQYSPSEPSNLFQEIWSIPNNENQNFDPAIDRDMCLVTRLHVDTNLLEEINTTPGTSVGSASSQSSYTGSTSVSQETSISTSTLNEDVDIQEYLQSKEEPPLPDMENDLIRLNNDVPLLDGNFHVALKVNLDPNFYMKDIATPPGLENIAEDEEGPLVIDLQQESHEPSSDNQMPEETEKIDETPAVIDTDVRMIDPGPSSRSVRYRPHYFNETLLTESDNATLHSRKRPYQEDTEDTVEDDGDANNNSRSEERKPPQKPYKGKGRGKRSR